MLQISLFFILKEKVRVGSLYFNHLYLDFQPEQLEEIQEIVEMKVSHRKNIKRRFDRFGHESNSLIGLNMAAADVIAPEEGDEEDPYA